MANDNVCVFCGEKPRMLQSMTMPLAGVYLPCCRTCYWELEDLSEEERCRRALRLGLVENPEKLEKHIEILSKVEEHRPTCPQCGSRLRFRPVQSLDNSPMRDGIFSSIFEVLPAVCENCGRYEFYDPEIAKKNEYLAQLIKQDKAE